MKLGAEEQSSGARSCSCPSVDGPGDEMAPRVAEMLGSRIETPGTSFGGSWSLRLAEELMPARAPRAPPA